MTVKGIQRWLAEIALRSPGTSNPTDGQIQAEVNMLNYLEKGCW